MQKPFIMSTKVFTGLILDKKYFFCLLTQKKGSYKYKSYFK